MDRKEHFTIRIFGRLPDNRIMILILSVVDRSTVIHITFLFEVVIRAEDCGQSDSKGMSLCTCDSLELSRMFLQRSMTPDESDSERNKMPKTRAALL